MSFSAPAPDIAGMGEAQQRLRNQLGRDVRFYGPADMVYDPSVPASAFDEEGIPLDPLAGASAVASAAVGIANLTIVGSARCNVVFQPLTAMRRDSVSEDRLGVRSRLNKDLILDISDRPQADAATHFQVGTLAGDGSWASDDEELWKIVNAKSDGFGALERYIVFGQGTR